jgi:hypothetical protein
VCTVSPRYWHGTVEPTGHLICSGLSDGSHILADDDGRPVVVLDRM